MIRIYAWDKNTKTGQILDVSTLRQGGDQLKGPHQVVWIDLENPTAEEEDLVYKQFFPVHPLTLEDITRLRREPDAPPHFPKVEEFADYLFVIINPLTHRFLEHVRQSTSPVSVEQLRTTTQLSAVVAPNLLITHHYEPVQGVRDLTAFLARHQ